MSDSFPDTPVSLLACIEERRGGLPYQNAWASFFDLYHAPLQLAVIAAFRRCGWYHVSEEILEETIADVVVSFFKADFSYKPELGKFRNYLRQLAAWRTQDKIAQLTQVGRNDPINADISDSAIDEVHQSPEEFLENKEGEAYRAALLATMLEDVRNRVSPQTYLMFEMTKILGHRPDEVAEQFKVKRNVVDNAAFRVLNKLKELATQPEYQKEYFQ